MGIVVTVFMVLILILSIPNPIEKRLHNHRQKIFIATFLMGAWNALWYGAQNTEEFWGLAALLSGSIMMITSLPNLPLEKSPAFIKHTLGWIQSKVKLLPQGFNEFMLLMLLACTCLYTYTLIQLNLS